MYSYDVGRSIEPEKWVVHAFKEPVASEHGAGEADGHGNHRHAASARCPDTEHESVEERAESDDFVDAEEWQVCPSRVSSRGLLQGQGRTPG